MNDLIPDEYEPEEGWTNYGDVNPKRHGGRFLRFTGDAWEVVETTHPDAIGDFAGGRHLFTVYEIQPGEVFDGPGEWSDEAAKELDSLGNVPDAEHYPPAGAAVDGRLDWLVAGLTHRLRPVTEGDSVDSGDYWERLESQHGIDADEYRD